MLTMPPMNKRFAEVSHFECSVNLGGHRVKTATSPSTKMTERKEVRKGKPVSASSPRQFMANDGETFPMRRPANRRSLNLGTDTSDDKIVGITRRFVTVWRASQT